MWGAITAAVVMAGIIAIARIATAALGERERAEDVAQAHDAIRLLTARVEDAEVVTDESLVHLDDRLAAAESKLAAVQSAQALGPSRRR